MKLRSACAIVGPLALLALPTSAAEACCGVSMRDVPVRFTHQINLIVWDPLSKVEHFVRNAQFQTDAKDLAFIAPTPSVPEMKKVDPEVFRELEMRRRAAEERARHPREADNKVDSKASGAGVKVEQEVDVAGFHATTLKASDATALANWLKDHNYPLTPAVKSWCEPYVAKGWYLTTFQVKANNKAAETGIVRLSFKAEKPFNPYFVPKSNLPKSGEGQGLDLYFVSTEQYSGKIGGKDDWIEPQIAFWPGSDLDGYLDLPSDKMPAELWATYFHDPSFPRADTDDVFFEPTPPAKRWKYRQPFDPVKYAPLAVVVPIGVWIAYSAIRRKMKPQ